MAVKTFTAGSVLTASDTNTYLANSGLVYVTSATIGTSVSSVAVANAFNSTYDNYKIICSGGTANTPQGISMILTGSTANYYSILSYWSYAAGANTVATTNNGANWGLVGESSQNSNTVDMDIIGPNTAKFTYFNGAYMGSVAGLVVGYHGAATAYTGFTLSVSGTMTGGTITVYGYRKA
jgi:hypothetical protein